MLVHAVIESAGRTERRLLDVNNGIVTIGRAPNCSLALDSGLVSRNHVSVDLNGSSMRVTDSSTNGTLAGETFVRSSTADVDFGVPIVIGDYMIWLSQAGANDVEGLRPVDPAIWMARQNELAVRASGALAVSPLAPARSPSAPSIPPATV